MHMQEYMNEHTIMESLEHFSFLPNAQQLFCSRECKTSKEKHFGDGRICMSK
jgi:hypothetical protein